MDNLSERYLFPSYCHIEEVSGSLATEQLSKEGVTDKFVLFNKNLKSMFFINDSTKNFLGLFSEPKSPFEVMQELGIDPNIANSENKEIVIKFFNAMIKRGFLIPELNNQNVEDKYLPAFPDYEIFETIKHSDFEAVCKATNKKTELKVVLKFLNFGNNVTEQTKTKRRSYFQQEFEIMYELNGHPNICSILRFETDKDLAVIELLNGKTLKELIKSKEISTPNKIYIVDQIINTLAYVHSKGIVHGDIHANQFIVNDSYELKLIDFGLSYRSNDSGNQVIRRGGIHNYLEPENITPNAFSNVIEYTPNFRSEVYRIGALLYFLIYDNYPFESFSWKQLCKLIQTEPPNLKRCFPNGDYIDGAYITLLSKALQKNPDERFASAIEMNKYLNEK